MLRICVLALLLVATAATAQAPGDAQLDAVVGNLMRARRIVGAAVAVVRDGRVIAARAYGDAKQGREPARPDTVFYMDSTTKQFTAAGIMLLVQQGRIGLDDPVRKYLPDAPASWNPIRIRHLLTHTAGFAHDPPSYPTIPVQNCQPGAMLEQLFRMAPRTPPGTAWAYSNAGYATLASILEKVTGGCYFEFMRTHVFGPLAMERTQLALYANWREPGHAAGYNVTPQGVREQDPVAHALGGGGIASTVLDLAKWDAALYGTSILTDASKTAMWTPFTLPDGKSTNYGFGWEIARTPIGTLVHHNGGGFGFSTAIYRYVDAKLTVIVLTNTIWRDGPKPANNGDAIAHAVAPLYAPKLPRPAAN
ncbi:MAG: serine hydrolase domain-containing protein [Burkholderiales bacterium]